MNGRTMLNLILFLSSIVVAGVLLVLYEPVWVIVLVSSGIVFGALSLMVYSRRLMFMAAASPHSAFLAAAVSIPLWKATGLSMSIWMLLVGLLLVYLVGLLTYKGIDPDEATSIFVSLSASGGVLASYYVMTRYPESTLVWSVVFGDPLLSSVKEALISLIVALVILLFSYTTVREIVYIGADVEDAKLSGVKVWLYDLALYTGLGISVIVMVRSVGFILEHVLILVPALIANYVSRGVYQTLTLSILLALFSSLSGLALAIGFNQSPSAMTGMLLVSELIVVYAARWSG